MITIRCTQKLRKFLGIDFIEDPPPPTAALGDWYANLVPTYAGDLIVFLSEKSLVLVAVPVWEVENLEALFVLRVVNMLGMLGVPALAARQEITHYTELQYAKTASRSVLGSLNNMVYNLQYHSSNPRGLEKLSLSDVELWLTDTPCGPLSYKSPAEVTRELLMENYGI